MDYVNNVIYTLVDKGVFGHLKEIVNWRFAEKNDVPHNSSNISFIEVNLPDGSTRHLFIKRQIPSVLLREIFNCSSLFKNEVFFYSNILPMLKADKLDLFPKMIHGVVFDKEENDKDIIVFEDIMVEGYGRAKHKVLTDYDHVILAIKKLGEFHGLSYAAKNHDKKLFFEKVSKLLESTFHHNVDVNKMFVNVSILRAIN